ncbi:MAG: hypothetical protein AB1757_04715 [Acidobacteriota bacterium]
MDSLASWDALFEAKFKELSLSARQTAGALLTITPSRAEWEDFILSIKTEWRYWQADLRYPHCLVALFGGLAFYEYNERNFWRPFAAAVGCPPLAAKQQQDINRYFADAAQNLGLKILKRETSMDYVGSAVFYIGIPLSLWDDFLKICAWALLHDEWRDFSETQWKEAIERRAGGRTRLKNFLLANREAASGFIQELLDARAVLSENEKQTIERKQASLLRAEYFEEVPETAEFLRPSNPESLFKNRASLVWQEDPCRIRLDLPGVERAKLPADWKIANLKQVASANSNSLNLNAAAFTKKLFLTLNNQTLSERQMLRGLAPYGLFDIVKNKFVNPERQELPISSYILIAEQPLTEFKREGFDEEENPLNEKYELEDGTFCYVTKLFPIGKIPQICFTSRDGLHQIRFRNSARIDARFYFGEGAQMANFSHESEVTRIAHLPIVCVVIPQGFSDNNLSLLEREFKVSIDESNEYELYGLWKKRYEDNEREIYFWIWDEEAVRLKRKPLRSSDGINPFAELGAYLAPPDLTGNRKSIYLTSSKLGLKFQKEIEVVKPIPKLEKFWKNLPGKMLPFFLLCQSVEGLKWEDMILAKEILAPNSQRFSVALLRKYESYGLLIQRGQKWQIAESLAVIDTANECHLSFCGDPSLLWGLYREISKENPGLLERQTIFRFENGKHIPQYGLPVIEVVAEPRCLPYFYMAWQKDLKKLIRTYLQKKGVRIVDDLWNAEP